MAGSTVANAVVVEVGVGGQVCLFTQSATHLLVDVDGYFPPWLHTKRLERSPTGDGILAP